MLQQFQQYQQAKAFQLEKKRSLIATSGGIDSVVLCHLFSLAKYPFAIAHCNFKLRDSASGKDELFVKELAQQLKVSYYTIAFETAKVAKERKQSIQVAARELRYEWLHRIRQAQDFDYLVTAHHLNDSIETVLYNFSKGCGIRGLHGILPKQGTLIRPLLFGTKTEIETFAKQENITFREDASNASDKYNRNKIRHHVVPILEQINPNFARTAQRTIQRLQETEALYDFAIENIKKKVVKKTATGLQIDLNLLKKQVASNTLLYEILKPYQFHPDIITQILKDKHQQSGSQFFSPSYQAVLHQHYLYVEARQEKKDEKINIEAKDQQVNLGHQSLQLSFSMQIPTIFSNNKNMAYLDAEVLRFPLVLRHWEAGDIFQPIGMKGKHQKLQDYFSNQKLSRLEKDKVWLLESDGKICWVVGYRMDERFKVTGTTKQVLSLRFSG